ncbi:hypothetical protein [Streptomyces sp. 8N706]
MVAVVDLPSALVRRPLRGGAGIPPEAEHLAERCAGALPTPAVRPAV